MSKANFVTSRPTKYTTHRLKEADRERVRCGTCGGPADICVHGNATGFYYYCDNDYTRSAWADQDRYTHEYKVTRYTLTKDELTIYADAPMTGGEVDIQTDHLTGVQGDELLYVAVTEPGGTTVTTFGDKASLPEHRRREI